MQKARETTSNIAASAISGMGKSKAIVQEKVEKMIAHDPMQKEMATQKKEDKIHQAELNKEEIREYNAAFRHMGGATGPPVSDGMPGLQATGGHHVSDGMPGRGTGHRTTGGHHVSDVMPGCGTGHQATGDVMPSHGTGHQTTGGHHVSDVIPGHQATADHHVSDVMPGHGTGHQATEGHIMSNVIGAGHPTIKPTDGQYISDMLPNGGAKGSLHTEGHSDF